MEPSHGGGHEQSECAWLPALGLQFTILYIQYKILEGENLGKTLHMENWQIANIVANSQISITSYMVLSDIFWTF